MMKALFDFSFLNHLFIEVIEKEALSRHLSVSRQTAERVATNDALNAREILLCKGLTE